MDSLAIFKLSVKIFFNVFFDEFVCIVFKWLAPSVCFSFLTSVVLDIASMFIRFKILSLILQTSY